jgi:hypothetical protein
MPLIAEEIAKEIIYRLSNQRFSNHFYLFLNTISDEGYYPL